MDNKQNINTLRLFLPLWWAVGTQVRLAWCKQKLKWIWWPGPHHWPSPPAVCEKKCSTSFVPQPAENNILLTKSLSYSIYLPSNYHIKKNKCLTFIFLCLIAADWPPFADLLQFWHSFHAYLHFLLFLAYFLLKFCVFLHHFLSLFSVLSFIFHFLSFMIDRNASLILGAVLHAILLQSNTVILSTVALKNCLM